VRGPVTHVGTLLLASCQAKGDASAQVAIYVRLTRRLKAAGARSVAVTSRAGHFCIAAMATLDRILRRPPGPENGV
jgi:aspartate racemase